MLFYGYKVTKLLKPFNRTSSRTYLTFVLFICVSLWESVFAPVYGLKLRWGVILKCYSPFFPNLYFHQLFSHRKRNLINIPDLTF